MESRGGRGGGTRLARVDSLVALGVGQLFVDVRRQRDMSHFGEIWFDGFCEKEEPLGASQHFHDQRFGPIFNPDPTA